MQLRTQMKADLVQAMKARQMATVTTLRTVLAAIDNAEAVPVSAATLPVEPIVGKSSEVPRKHLSAEDIRQIVQQEAAALRSASATYAHLGQPTEAERLHTAAALLAAYLAD